MKSPKQRFKKYVISVVRLQKIIENFGMQVLSVKNFPKFTGKHLCRSLFFNKVGGLRIDFIYRTLPMAASYPTN